MTSFTELVVKVEQQEKTIAELKQRMAKMEQKLQGEGVIVLSGNRLKIDVSGSLSDYQLKS